MTHRLTTDASASEFLRRLYSSVDAGFSEVRGIDLGERLSERSRARWFPIATLGNSSGEAVGYAAFLNADGYDVFLGVNPRIRGGQEDDDVLSGCALWADVDNLPSVEQAEEKLEECLRHPLKPDAAVYTGNGVHLYWFLKEAVDPADKEGWEKYLRSLKAMCNLVGGDPVCCNPSRVLRFPLSKSWKRGVQTLLWLSDA